MERWLVRGEGVMFFIGPTGNKREGEKKKRDSHLKVLQLEEERKKEKATRQEDVMHCVLDPPPRPTDAVRITCILFLKGARRCSPNGPCVIGFIHFAVRIAKQSKSSPSTRPFRAVLVYHHIFFFYLCYAMHAPSSYSHPTT